MKKYLYSVLTRAPSAATASPAPLYVGLSEEDLDAASLGGTITVRSGQNVLIVATEWKISAVIAGGDRIEVDSSDNAIIGKAAVRAHRATFSSLSGDLRAVMAMVPPDLMQKLAAGAETSPDPALAG